MNSVHPHHDPRRFERLRHFVFAFHDSTFECVADEFRVTQVRGSMHDAVQMMSDRLRGD